MPNMSSDNPVVAIAVADLHITAEAPIARSGEPSWPAVLKRQFDQLKQLAFLHGVPIICAGDVFDRWNTSAEGISLALEHMPRMFAVPGQHDLPYHSLEGIGRSAYGVLMRAGKIENLEPGKPRVFGCAGSTRPIRLHGYPWGVPVQSQNRVKGDKCLEIAVVHAYCWTENFKHQGAADSSKVSNFNLKGFDTAVFGDNHKPFTISTQGCDVSNCGGFFRRKSDEMSHHPTFTLIREDGSITLQPVVVKEDIFIAKAAKDVPTAEELLGVAEFVESLNTENKHSFDFVEALKIYRETHKLSPVASKLLHQLTNDSE